jgi:transcriptional regulator with XRE-family HTH domain
MSSDGRPSSEELRERFGLNLRECRRRAGIGQRELAFRSEVSQPSVSAFELGISLPRTDTVIRLAGALGVTPGDLVAGIRWMPAETVVTPGEFAIPEDPELAEEVATLRATSPGRKRRR